MKNDNIFIKWKDFVNNPKYKNYFLSFEEIWIENLNSIEKIIIDKSIKNKTNLPEKYKNWLNNQLKNYRDKLDGLKCKKRRELFYNFLERLKEFGFSLNKEEKWINDLEKIKNTQFNNLSKFQKNWIRKQKINYSKNIDNSQQIMKNPEIHGIWTEFINNPIYTNLYKKYDAIENIIKKIKNFEIYIMKNGFKPPPTSNDKIERKWGQFYNHYKKIYNKKTEIMTDENIRNIWENMHKTYCCLNLKAVTLETRNKRFKDWIYNLNEYLKFKIINGEPSKQSKGIEKKLYRWKINQQYKYNKKTLGKFSWGYDERYNNKWKEFIII